jgi:hypothetical protein
VNVPSDEMKAVMGSNPSLLQREGTAELLPVDRAAQECKGHLQYRSPSTIPGVLSP